MTTRTDCHRPSAFKHDDYTFIAFGTYRDEVDPLVVKVVAEQQEIVDNFRSSTGATWSDHDHGGMCHVCGASFLDYCIFYHTPTNSLIKVGNDCAKQIQDGNPVAGYEKFRHSVKVGIAAKAGVKKANMLMQQNCPNALEILQIWDEYQNSCERDPETGSPTTIGGVAVSTDEFGVSRDQDGNRVSMTMESFEVGVINDMYRQLIRKGSLSDKQWSFMNTCVEKEENRAKVEAARKAEADARPPLPDCILNGRNRIEGEIVTKKDVNNDYGVQTKVLVKSDYGWVVWGTLPSAIDNANRGDKIAFNALVNKGDGNGFGFFSRPTKAEILCTSEEVSEEA